MFDSRDNDYRLTVEGDSEADCIRQIKEKCGNNYQVLSRKTVVVPYGFLNLRKKEVCQLSYCIKTNYSSYNTYAYNALSSGSALDLNSPMNNQQQFQSEQQKILEKSGKKDEVGYKLILDEISDLKAEMGKMSGTSNSEHETILKIQDLLEENEFSASYIRKMCDKIKNEFSLTQLDDFELVQDAVVRWIGQSISVDDAVYSKKPQVIVLVGPTGVGKTTTIAKLACRLAYSKDYESKNYKVHLIAADNYRIAAVNQLANYAEYMSVPFNAVDPNKNDLIKIMNSDNCLSDDFILIDTTGYSPKDYESIAKLKKSLDLKNNSIKFYLCASATTKLSDLKEIMNQFEIFGYNSLIVTKFDETNHIGNIVCACQEKDKKISYITTGQDVPVCFEKATVLRFLLELTGFKINKEQLEQEFGPLDVYFKKR